MPIFYMFFLMLLNLNQGLLSSNSTKEIEKKINEKDKLVKKQTFHKNFLPKMVQELNAITPNSLNSERYKEDLSDTIAYTHEEIDRLDQEIDRLNQEIDSLRNYQPQAGHIRRRSSGLENGSACNSNPQSGHVSQTSSGLGAATACHSGYSSQKSSSPGNSNHQNTSISLNDDDDDSYETHTRHSYETDSEQNPPEGPKPNRSGGYDPTGIEIPLPPPLTSFTPAPKTAPAAASSNKKLNKE